MPDQASDPYSVARALSQEAHAVLRRKVEGHPILRWDVPEKVCQELMSYPSLWDSNSPSRFAYAVVNAELDRRNARQLNL